jgi:hypothetical protein
MQHEATYLNLWIRKHNKEKNKFTTPNMYQEINPSKTTLKQPAIPESKLQ